MHVEILSINFKTNSDEQQARIILDKVSEIHKIHPLIKVGITYSANHQQTAKIASTYLNGNWQTGASGGNQAAVIGTIEKLLLTSHKDLQKVFRIVPITTMDYEKPGYTARDADVKKSLDNASQFITGGNYLLGWSNHLTPNSVAIGGGIAANAQTKAQKEMIEQWIQQTFIAPSKKCNAMIGLGPGRPLGKKEEQPHIIGVEQHLIEKKRQGITLSINKLFDTADAQIKARANSTSAEVKDVLDTISRDLDKIKTQFLVDLKQYHFDGSNDCNINKLHTELTKDCLAIFENRKLLIEKEQGWSDFALDFIKKIANVIINLCTFGHKEHFFNTNQSFFNKTAAVITQWSNEHTPVDVQHAHSC